MKLPNTLRVQTLLLTGLCSAACALAQTSTPTKPAAKPAAKASTKAAAPANSADGKTASLGNGAGTGPLLTREELRLCLANDVSLRERNTGLESRLAAMNKEKDALTATSDAMRSQHAVLEDAGRRGDDLQTRMKAFGARVEAYNQRSEAASKPPPANKSMLAIEREGKELERERLAIVAQQTELEAERVKLVAESSEAARVYNDKVAAENAKMDDWNRRSAALRADAAALQVESDAWKASCFDRRYREDDEIAIKRGK